MPSLLKSSKTLRNPFPIPDVTSEGYWLPPGPVLGENIASNDRGWSKKLDPHERLFAHHTLNSVRRDNRFIRNKAPNDALDLALTSTYAHNRDTLVPKMYVYMQPEALGHKTWRVLRNELKTSSSSVSGLSIVGKASSDSASVPESGRSLAEQQQQQQQQHQQRDTSYDNNSRQRDEKNKNRTCSQGTMRAASAPVKRSVKHQTEVPLHKYPEKNQHFGLPDRIERIHPSSLKLAIQGPHIDRTNPGYSRKDDGTFYGV